MAVGSVNRKTVGLCHQTMDYEILGLALPGMTVELYLCAQANKISF